MIDVETSRLMMELFNRMTVKQKNNVDSEDAGKICDFMVANGYRLAFNKWYLQAEPRK